MPRMSKSKKLEWSFYLNDRGRKAYNTLPLSQKQERIFFENFLFRYLRFDEEMSVVK